MKLNAYSLKGEAYISSLQSQALHLIHRATGAEVLLLKNNDKNKTFAIGFRTPPEDSTGVAHIVEHSTLSGSRKYRTKEPFMDMVASSLQTFLNAMTYPDKTLYPISSRNDKDFRQLMDLYLDSVFHPRMEEVKEIFLQEGWHYDWTEEGLAINGVVYNEMRGVYSDPSNQVSDLIREEFFPTGTYSHDSGGNPKYIPDLSYEDFLDFHRRYYHPSNAYIILAGDMDFEERLDFLDREYLSQFERTEPHSEVVHAPLRTEPHEFTASYAIAPQEYREGLDYFTLGWTVKTHPTPYEHLVRSFIDELLVGGENAPIKKKILEAGLAEDVYTEHTAGDSLDLIIVSYHSKKEDFPKFTSLIMDSLREVAEEGMDQRDLEATLSKFEFALRQGGGAHRALIAYINTLSTWLYGGDPLEQLNLDALLERLRSEMTMEGLKKYIREWFLEGTAPISGLLSPDTQLLERQARELSEKLKAKEKSLSPEEKEEIIRTSEALREFQNAPDSFEAQATIPRLSLEDIPPSITPIPTLPLTELTDEMEGIFLPQPTNGIVYGHLAFDLSHLSGEELSRFALLTELLGKIPTEKYSLEELDQELSLHTGGIQVDVDVISKKDGSYYPVALVNLSALREKLPQGVALLEEILLHSRYDDERKIRELLVAAKADMENSILQGGHSAMILKTKSYFDGASALSEATGGLELYHKLSELLEGEVSGPAFEALSQKVFLKNTLTLGITGEEEGREEILPTVKNFLSALPEAPVKALVQNFAPQRKNEAFTSSSQVNYVAQGYNFKALGASYDGTWPVLANLVSMGYLHNEIRAKGGAYGSGIQATRNGNLVAYSYRDPRVKETLEVYRSIPQYLEELNLSPQELTNYIIGTMNVFDPHSSPQGYGSLGFKRYLAGLTSEDVEQTKAQALATTLEDIKDKADIVRKVMTEDVHAAMGNDEALKASEEFKDYIPLRK
ncbi:MAG: insulinase family protein [Tissierellia bacterium]|nr:insulinase family protein [Tissierellia bacterium]